MRPDHSMKHSLQIDKTQMTTACPMTPTIFHHAVKNNYRKYF